MHEILDLQRDLHANDVAFIRIHLCDLDAHICHSLIVRERVAFCSMLGVFSRLLLALQLSVLVS